MNSDRVIVFLKAPRPGFVKTRIAAKLDAEGAAAIYQVLVGLTLSRLGEHADVELRFAPDDAAAEVSAWRKPGWRMQAQGDGDLGDRMARAVTAAFEAGSRKVLLLGADCPAWSRRDLEDASRALERHDVVLGPSMDGGYWLLGLGKPAPAIFRAIPWSTDQVRTLTLERSREAGLSVTELRCLRDVDTLEDWRAWQRESPR